MVIVYILLGLSVLSTCILIPAWCCTGIWSVEFQTSAVRRKSSFQNKDMQPVLQQYLPSYPQTPVTPMNALPPPQPAHSEALTQVQVQFENDPFADPEIGHAYSVTAFPITVHERTNVA